jgi:hypothetical protein
MLAEIFEYAQYKKLSRNKCPAFGGISLRSTSSGSFLVTF